MTNPPARNQALYFTLIGVVVGLLLAGLVIPLGFGTRQADDFVAFDQADPGEGVPDRLTGPVDGDARDPGESVEEGLEGAPGARGSALEDVGPSRPARPAAETGPDGTAGGAPHGPDTAAATGEGQSASPGLTATDRGVTAEAIKLAILLYDLGAVGELGLDIPASPEQQRRWWGAWVSDLNQRGGVHGRQIDAHYIVYDILSEDAMRAACLEAAQDQGVFAAMDTGAIGHGTVLCFTQEHQTPFITLGSTGYTERDYQRSGGLLFSLLPEGRRTMANFAWELHQLGELAADDALGVEEQKAIGIVSTETPGGRQTIENGAVAMLEQLGYEISVWAQLSADTSVAAGQIPVAVNQLRANNVQAVLLFNSLFNDTQIAQHAESQRYFPNYYLTDWNGAWSERHVLSMPDSFNATLITTSRSGDWQAGIPEPPAARECAQTYLEHTGRKLDRDEDDLEHWAALQTCQVFRLFELGAHAAGPELTRAVFSRALQSVGEIPLATFGGGSLSPGKFGVADLVRTAAFRAGCRCWWPVDDFRRPRF